MLKCVDASLDPRGGGERVYQGVIEVSDLPQTK